MVNVHGRLYTAPLLASLAQWVVQAILLRQLPPAMVIAPGGRWFTETVLVLHFCFLADLALAGDDSPTEAKSTDLHYP